MTRTGTAVFAGRSTDHAAWPSRPWRAASRPRALAWNTRVPFVAGPTFTASARLVFQRISPVEGTMATMSPSRLAATIDPAHRTGSPARGALKPLQVQDGWNTSGGGLWSSSTSGFHSTGWLRKTVLWGRTARARPGRSARTRIAIKGTTRAFLREPNRAARLIGSL